jgi:WD40 repeat protein
VCFSFTDELIAGSGRTLLVWPLGRPGAATKPQRLPDFPAPITAVAVRPGRRELAIGLSNGALYVLRKGRKAHVDLLHAGGVKRIAYDPAGGVLVTGGTDGRIVWRNAESLAPLEKTAAHSSEVAGLAFSENGARVASGDWNGELKIWDAAARTVQRELTQSDAVAALGWAGENIVTGSWDGRIRIFSAGDGETLDNFDTGVVIADLAVHPNGDTAATVATDGIVRLWRLSRP